MPKVLVQDEFWRDRLDSADKYYKQWAGLFKCDILEKYYEGQQWKSQRELSYNPYVINKVYETVQIKLAEFVPTFPKYTISSKPANAEYDLEAAADSAQLKEDTLNSIIQDDRHHFSEEVEQAYKDSFFRFGMMEVGYAADWILNPNAQKPLLKGDTERHLSGKERYQIKLSPDELPVNERVYFKHISAKRFRVGGLDHKYLDRCGWIGYYDYVYKDDLLAMPKLMQRSKIEIASGVNPNSHSETNDYNTETLKADAIKLWFIWDLRSRMRLLVLDSPCVTVYQKGFKRIPLFDYRPDRRMLTEGFYPVPPVFHWLSPQDEINETREMLRAHRRRFVRKFQVIEGTMDDEEIEKFETGSDGAILKVKRENAITPIENADLGNALNEAIQTSGDDLNRISGTSDQERGITDRGTATEANIIQQRGAARGNKERDRVVRWFSGIGREGLLVIRDKFTLGIWINQSSPEGEQFLGSIVDENPAYKWVTAEDLNDGYDFRINVDITSLSVSAQEDEKKHFMEFLAVMNQFPQLAFSPLLVREAAYRVGYRNSKVIKELQKMALLAEMGRMAQLQASVGGPQMNPAGGNNGQQIMAEQTPPTGPAIQKQLGNQLVQ